VRREARAAPNARRHELLEVVRPVAGSCGDAEAPVEEHHDEADPQGVRALGTGHCRNHELPAKEEDAGYDEEHEEEPQAGERRREIGVFDDPQRVLAELVCARAGHRRAASPSRAQRLLCPRSASPCSRRARAGGATTQ
jgi:hypothetical protein